MDSTRKAPPGAIPDDGSAAERARMVRRQIQARGVSRPEVLAAMERVPRERFVPASRRPSAFADRALPIGHGQTISQPYMVAAMTEALELDESERVLEIGTGSGYQTAVLAELARHVYTVERIPALSHRARETLSSLGYANISFRTGDGTLGWPEEAPFDAVLVTAGAPRVPDALVAQLRPDGGRLVVPVGSQDVQDLVRVTRTGDEEIRETLFGCRFVPLVGEEGW